MLSMREGSADAVELERLVDVYGVDGVVVALASICWEKEAHVRSNWQDEGLAREWSKAGKRLDEVCLKLPSLP